jgi:hypothetical protein
MKPKFYTTDSDNMIYAVYPDTFVAYAGIDSWKKSVMADEKNIVEWFRDNADSNPTTFADIKAALNSNCTLKALEQLHAEWVGMKSAIPTVTQHYKVLI